MDDSFRYCADVPGLSAYPSKDIDKGSPDVVSCVHADEEMQQEEVGIEPLTPEDADRDG